MIVTMKAVAVGAVVAAVALAVLGSASARAASISPAASHHAPVTPISIEAPGRDAVVVGADATIRSRIRVAAGVTQVRIRVAGAASKDVTGRFHRDGPIWVATLRVGRDLEQGPQTLTVRGRYRGHRVARAVAFAVAGRRASLLRVTGLPRRAARRPLVVRLRTDRRVDDIKASVNGRNARDVFARLSGGIAGLKRAPARWAGRISATDGLRYGRNRVVISAFDRDGLYQRVTRNFTIARGRPLVGAGRDVTARVGRIVRLNGSSTRLSGSASTRWRWQIVGRPNGSRVRLRHAASRRLRFRPDRPGTYRVRLTVSQRGPGLSGTRVRRSGEARPGLAVSSDVATVTVAPNETPQGTPIQTMVQQGGQTGIQVGSSFYAMGPIPNAIQILVLDASTLQPVANDAAYSPNSFVDFVNGTGANQLIVISAPSGIFLPSNGINPYTLVLTSGTGDPNNSSGSWTGGVPNGPFSAITGTDGRTATTLVGIRESPGAQAGAMTGSLEPSTSTSPDQAPPSHVFAWPFTDVTFNTHAATSTDSNTMTINGNSYTSGTVSDGFQVVWMSAASLGNAQQATVSGGSALGNVLTQLNDAGSPKLVFVTSIGNPAPIPPDTVPDNNWIEAAQAVSGLGGTQTGLLSLNGSPQSVYSLVGVTQIGVDAPGSGLELSGPIRGLTDPGLQGVLSRSPAGVYQPSTGGGTAAFQDPSSLEPALNAVLAQPAQQWPSFNFPGGNAAAAYIAGELPFTSDPATAAGIRANYYNAALSAQWGNELTVLEGMTACATSPCSLGFKAVQKEFETEFADVEAVRGFFGNDQTGTLYGALNSTFTDSTYGFTAAQNAVEAAYQPPPDAQASGIDGWDLTEGLLWGASTLAAAANPAISAGLALTASALQIASVFSNTSPSNTYTGPTPIYTAASSLGTTLADKYNQTLNGLQHIADLLVSDPGRLVTADQQITAGDWTPTDTTDSALEQGLNQYIWQTLLSSTFGAFECTVPIQYGNQDWSPNTANHTPTNLQFSPFATIIDFPEDPRDPDYGNETEMASGFLTAGNLNDNSSNLSDSVANELFGTTQSGNVYPLGLIPQYFFVPQSSADQPGFVTSHGSLTFGADQLVYQCAGNEWTSPDFNPDSRTAAHQRTRACHAAKRPSGLVQPDQSSGNDKDLGEPGERDHPVGECRSWRSTVSWPDKFGKWCVCPCRRRSGPRQGSGFGRFRC